MNKIASLREKIQHTGMLKVAAAIKAMPPRKRLLTRMVLVKNAGLLGDILTWSAAHPELVGAGLTGGAGALIGALAAPKKRLAGALVGGGAGALAGVAGGNIFRNWEKIKSLFGKKAPAADNLPKTPVEAASGSPTERAIANVVGATPQKFNDTGKEGEVTKNTGPTKALAKQLKDNEYMADTYDRINNGERIK